MHFKKMFYSVLLDHCIVFFNNSLPNCFLMISSLYCCLCEALRNMEFEKSSIDKDYSVNNYRSHEQCKKNNQCLNCELMHIQNVVAVSTVGLCSTVLKDHEIVL